MAMRPFIPVLSVLSLLAAGCAQPAPGSGSAAPSRLDLLSSAMRTVNSKYVEPVGDAELVEGALRGMMQSLDPHSDYMSEADFRAFLAEASGAFGGVGIEIGQEEEQLSVIAPIDGTPAARAGLRPGDRIQAIDGKPTKGLSLSESVRLMRGPVGMPVTLSIQREDGEPFDVTLTREIIEIDPVEARIERGVGYIRLKMFTERAADALRDAVGGLRREAGGPLRGWVLDLRNDPGGLLDQAVEVADMFLDDGGIVSVRGRQPGDRQVYRARPGDITEGAPIVVLINGGSASAAEIVAGALQDHGRAKVVGTPSFGKGSVQTVIPLPEGGALRLTTARYYTPSGRSIQAVGIEPDVVVASAGMLEPEQREADLEGALRNDTSAGPGEARMSMRQASLDGRPATPGLVRPGGEPGAEVDEPLERALSMLGAGPAARR